MKLGREILYFRVTKTSHFITSLPRDKIKPLTSLLFWHDTESNFGIHYEPATRQIQTCHFTTSLPRDRITLISLQVCHEIDATPHLTTSLPRDRCKLLMSLQVCHDTESNFGLHYEPATRHIQTCHFTTSLPRDRIKLISLQVCH
jgi:hypothetical protein